MGIIYLKNRDTLVLEDEKAINIRKAWLDKTTDLSKDLIINNWRGNYRDISRIELEDGIKKQNFTPQELAVEAPNIKRILLDQEDTKTAWRFYMNQKGIMRDETVIEPQLFKKYDRLFTYVLSKESKPATEEQKAIISGKIKNL